MKFIKIVEPSLGVNAGIKMVVRYDNGLFAGALHEIREGFFYYFGDDRVGEKRYTSIEEAMSDLRDIYFIEGL